MKFSLLFLTAYDPHTHGSERDLYEQMLAQVDFAEAAGFHRVWMAEHHVGGYGGQLPCVPVMLSAVAQRTRRIGLGSGGVCVPLHKPLELAEQLAMVDVLSGGRLEVGCANAFLPYEFDAFNISMDESRERFRESIEIMRGLWSNERFSYAGKYSQLDDVQLTPRPLQRPHPPLSIATIMTRESFEYAGANAFNLMVVPYINSLDDVAERIGWYHDSLRANGHDPAAFNVMGAFHLFCHENHDHAYAHMRRPMVEYLKNVRDSAGRGRFGKGYAGYEKMAAGIQQLMDNYDLMFAERTLYGTPEKLIAQSRAAEAAGLTEISLITILPAVSAEDSMRSLRMFAEQVMPAFRQ